MKNIFKKTSLLLLLGIAFNSYSQDTINRGNSGNKKEKHFRVGLYIGSYFANQYTASMYDGYGFDIDGNKNSFYNSFMYQKIVNENGGAYGQPDLIADELKVDRQTWVFDRSDMPTNMRYTPAFSVGITCRYSVDKKNSILFNLNAVKLNISGNFTINTPTSQTGSSNQTNNVRIHTFGIKGTEQRLMIQLGYQRIMGENEKINLLVEGGLHATLAKFDKNIIQVNNLQIDLTSYYNQPGLPASLLVRKPIGIGFGAFAGIGANVTMNPKATLQLIYSPTYEKIDMGINPRYKLQNAIGLRFYYNI